MMIVINNIMILRLKMTSFYVAGYFIKGKVQMACDLMFPHETIFIRMRKPYQLPDVTKN